MSCSAMQAIECVRKEELSARTRYFAILNSLPTKTVRSLKPAPGTMKENMGANEAAVSNVGNVQPGIDGETSDAAAGSCGQLESMWEKPNDVRTLAGLSFREDDEDQMGDDRGEDLDDSTEAVLGDEDIDAPGDGNVTEEEETRYQSTKMSTRIKLRKNKFLKLRSMCGKFGDLPMRDYVGAVVFHYQH